MDPNLPDLAPLERSRVYARLATTLADLHSLNPSALGLDGFGNPLHYCRRQVCARVCGDGASSTRGCV
jgi:acyl-CoA dehydrogenase